MFYSFRSLLITWLQQLFDYTNKQLIDSTTYSLFLWCYFWSHAHSVVHYYNHSTHSFEYTLKLFVSIIFEILCILSTLSPWDPFYSKDLNTLCVLLAQTFTYLTWTLFLKLNSYIQLHTLHLFLDGHGHLRYHMSNNELVLYPYPKSAPVAIFPISVITISSF